MKVSLSSNFKKVITPIEGTALMLREGLKRYLRSFKFSLTSMMSKKTRDLKEKKTKMNNLLVKIWLRDGARTRK